MKKVLLYFFALNLFVLSMYQSPLFAQQSTLVQDGKPAAQIVISAGASPTEKYVATDLQQIVQRISGAELSIKNAIDKSTFNVVIGTPQSMPEINAANLFKSSDSETIRIATQGKVLFLAGNSPASALRAVYTFLHDQLHCRWFWPGDTGEYLPSQKTISIGKIDVTEVPDIRERSLSINTPHWDDDTVVWMSRNRMNWHHLQGSTVKQRNIDFLHERGLKALVGGHNITLPKEMLEKHPEYIAMFGGKRQLHPTEASHLCWSNPGVQNAVAAKVEDWWENNPTVDSISFLAADQTHFCECDQCKIMAPDVSTRWQKFIEIIVNKVNVKYPGKHYQALAYQAYRDIPTQVAPIDLIGYTTYNINYTKPITDPSNEKARQEIEQWQKIGGNMGIRGYQFIPFNESMYAPIAPLIMEEVAWAHNAGLKGWKSELRPYGHPRGSAPEKQNWVTHRMALYAVAQAMWNSSQKPEDVTRDWSQRIYGPAADPMFNYYTAMQKAWVESAKPLTYFLQPPASFVKHFISDELLEQAAKSFQQAQSATSKIANAAVQKRISEQLALEEAMFDDWRQVFLMQQGRAGRFKVEAARVVTPPQVTANPADPAWKNIRALPAFEDKDRNAAAEKTTAYLQWDADALYLRFVNEDNDIAQLKATDTTHDGGIFGDDAIEFFLNNPSQPGHYFHLVINLRNTRYDAKVDSAMNMDKSWNPKFESQTSVGSGHWILDLKLPFAEFGIDAKEGATWEMSFKRNSAGRRVATGWPDASYHNPAGFGTVTLVDKVAQQKRIVTYDAGNANKDALLTALREAGFTVHDAPVTDSDFETAFAQGADIVSLYHPGGDQFKLSDDVVQRNVVPFVKNGGLLIVSGYGNKPLAKWFGAELAAKWDGWKIDPNRKSTFVAEGEWQTLPHDLSRALQRSTTPASGFTPQSDKWEVLARMRVSDGTESAYLLRQKVGKGEVVLTSSNFGYGGGGEIFGNMNPGNVAKLIDNLLANRL